MSLNLERIASECSDDSSSISRLPAPTLVAVWKATFAEVRDQVTSGKAVQIKGLGTFTFNFGATEKGNRGTELHRIPMFVPEEAYLRAHHLTCSKPSPATTVALVQLSTLKVAGASGVQKTAVPEALRDLLGKIGAHGSAGESADIDVAIGRLTVSGKVLRVVFSRAFADVLGGEAIQDPKEHFKATAMTSSTLNPSLTIHEEAARQSTAPQPLAAKPKPAPAPAPARARRTNTTAPAVKEAKKKRPAQRQTTRPQKPEQIIKGIDGQCLHPEEDAPGFEEDGLCDGCRARLELRRKEAESLRRRQETAKQGALEVQAARAKAEAAERAMMEQSQKQLEARKKIDDANKTLAADRQERLKTEAAALQGHTDLMYGRPKSVSRTDRDAAVKAENRADMEKRRKEQADARRQSIEEERTAAEKAAEETRKAEEARKAKALQSKLTYRDALLAQRKEDKRMSPASQENSSIATKLPGINAESKESKEQARQDAAAVAAENKRRIEEHERARREQLAQERREKEEESRAAQQHIEKERAEAARKQSETMKMLRDEHTAHLQKVAEEQSQGAEASLAGALPGIGEHEVSCDCPRCRICNKPVPPKPKVGHKKIPQRFTLAPNESIIQ